MKKAGKDVGWLGMEADTTAVMFHQYVRSGCDLVMPKRGMTGGRCPVYWWNDDIATKTTECIGLRRAYQRTGRKGGVREPERLAYSTAKKALRKVM